MASSRAFRPNTSERTSLDRFDEVITSDSVRSVSRGLFSDGHYARAVEEAFKFLSNEVKETRSSNADGAGLMRTAFSANSPLLQLNNLQSESEKDEQKGCMDIYAGIMTGIRNPRAHVTCPQGLYHQLC